MALNLRSKWKAFRRNKAVKVTTKVISTILKCFLTIFLIGVITASIVGSVLVVYVVNSFDTDKNFLPTLEDISQNQTSFIYVKDEKTGEWKEQQRIEGENMVWTDLEDIPVNLQNAVIAIEDERFNEHYGVDWKRTISAFANLIFHFSSQEYGGSTLTQQVIKVVTQDNEHSIERKIAEIFRAIEMEKKYTKDDILEAYLNLLPLGAVDGVGSGANYFFGKDVGDLTLAECAYLASITKGPSLYSPYLHPQNARSRQQTVLYKMYELGMITAEEYKQAANEEVTFRSSIRNVSVQDYYVDMIIEDVIADLMDEYGYTYLYAENMVFHGGLRIYSAEIPEQQAKVEAIFADESNFPKKIESDKEDPQAAIFIMDYDGRIVATVGARGEKTADRVKNRSTTSKRQPGSSMKPLGAYSLAVDMDLVTYSSLIEDKPITLANGSKWPENFGNGHYGTIPLEVHLQRSVNTVAAQLVEMLTPQKSFDYVTGKLGLSTLIKPEKREDGQIYTDITYSALALGGMTDGVYCSEMANAYQVFGNGGIYNKAFSYYKVEQVGRNDTTQLLLETNNIGTRALAEDSAYVMNRMMQRVIFGPHGTAKDLASTWANWGNIFGKTGTSGSTESTHDSYFAGGTPYYVGACWMGYDYNKNLNSAQTKFTRQLWSKSMLALHEGLEFKDYEHKGDVVEHEYCYDTGMLATPACTNTRMGVYKKSNVPGYCTLHNPQPEPEPTTTPGTEPTTEPDTDPDGGNQGGEPGNDPDNEPVIPVA